MKIIRYIIWQFQKYQSCHKNQEIKNTPSLLGEGAGDEVIKIFYLLIPLWSTYLLIILLIASNSSSSNACHPKSGFKVFHQT